LKTFPLRLTFTDEAVAANVVVACTRSQLEAGITVAHSHVVEHVAVYIDAVVVFSARFAAAAIRINDARGTTLAVERADAVYAHVVEFTGVDAHLTLVNVDADVAVAVHGESVGAFAPERAKRVHTRRVGIARVRLEVTFVDVCVKRRISQRHMTSNEDWMRKKRTETFAIELVEARFAVASSIQAVRR
jgi:hypothetical protein